jgi:hypothetical protein
MGRRRGIKLESGEMVPLLRVTGEIVSSLRSCVVDFFSAKVELELLGILDA